MSLTVKAYVGDFEKNHGKDVEIRRFAIDPSVSTNYDYLTTKIMQVFPSLAGKTFKTFWKDPDADFVSFSTGEELVEALGFVTDGVFKVFIRPEIEGNKAFHPGVACDGCQGPIYGNRFKCAVCPDYDLCSVCDSKGLHNDHIMMRICFYEQKHELPTRGWMGFGPPPPPHGPHHGPPGPPPPGPHGEEGPHGQGFPHWRRTMRQMWRRWWRENGGHGMPPHCASESPQGRGGCRRGSDKGEAEGSEAPQQEKAEQQTKKDGCEDDNPAEDYLKNVGDSVAAMLDPLGIDVEIDVEHKGRRHGCRGRGRQGPWGGRWGRGGWRGFWGGYPQGQGQSWGCPDSASESASNQSSMNSTTSCGVNQTKDVDMEADTAKQAVPVHTEEQATPKAATSEEKGHQEMPMSPETTEGGDVEWTMLDVASRKGPAAMAEGVRQETSASPKPPPAAESTMVTDTGNRLYPTVTETEVPAHVVEPLQHMLSMGFNNDDAWLTRLLVEKNGNISQTLDVIQRASRNK